VGNDLDLQHSFLHIVVRLQQQSVLAIRDEVLDHGDGQQPVENLVILLEVFKGDAKLLDPFLQVLLVPLLFCRQLEGGGDLLFYFLFFLFFSFSFFLCNLQKDLSVGGEHSVLNIDRGFPIEEDASHRWIGVAVTHPGSVRQGRQQEGVVVGVVIVGLGHNCKQNIALLTSIFVFENWVVNQYQRNITDYSICTTIETGILITALFQVVDHS